MAAGSTDGGADGGSTSEYSDEVGSTIGVLDGSGVITATTLEFGTVDLGEDTPPSILALAGAGDDDGTIETVGSSPAPVITAADLGLDSDAGPIAPWDTGPAAAAVGPGDEQIIQQLLDGTRLAA